MRSCTWIIFLVQTGDFATMPLQQAEYGTHVISSDQVAANDLHHHHHRAFAVYEKQLFYEKMIAACYMDSEVLTKCQALMHSNAIEIPHFKEIWSDRTLHPQSKSSNWITSERLRAMEEETRREDNRRRPERMWQNFEVILRVPEPVYCPEQYWFKIDEYSVPRLADSGKGGKVFFCPGCESHKEEAQFCRDDTDFAPQSAFPEQCIGCTFKNAHYTTVHKVKNYAELRDNETYALACAYYIYLHDLHDLQPADDLMEYIRKCCPIAYKQVGQIVSSYGGIRCTPSQALDFLCEGRQNS